METTIEKKQELHTLKVFDSEKEDFIDVTPEMQRHAAYVHQQIAMGTFMIALAIKKMFDEKLYLGLGCSSKSEYCETMLPFGRRQAYRYYEIGKKFQKFLPENGESVTYMSQTDGLTMNKLYELTKIDDADFEELMETGEVDGFNLEQFKRQTYKEAMKELNVLKAKSSRRISILEAENAKLKAERKALDAIQTEAEEKLKLAKEIEDRFGAAKASVDEKRRIVNEAMELLNRAGDLILNCGVTVDDPVTLKNDTIAMYKKLNLTLEYWQHNYGELLLDMEHLGD